MKQRRLVVGISGKIGHGKDVVASALTHAHGAVRLGFSEELKEEVLARLRRTLKEIVYAGVGPDNTGPFAIPEPMRWLRNGRDKDEAWWDKRLRWELWHRKQPIIRRLLQEWGTELRRWDDADYWCKAWLKRLRSMDAPLVVVPDARFVNEAAYIRMTRGLLVRVERPGFTAASELGADAHDASEKGLDDHTEWDHVFHNTGTVDELRAAALGWFRTVTRFAPITGHDEHAGRP